MADDNPSDEAPVTFSVKSSSDAKYSVTISLASTVQDLKEKLATKDFADIPVERQRLIYSGRVLKDADTLASYKIKEGHTIHLVKGAASNQRQNPANQGVSAGSTSAGGAAPSMPSMAAGTGNNPLAGLTGARYAGFAQLPNQEMFGPDGGMGPPPDPEHMARMLQNPQFASMLNEALSNPSVVDMMIQQNPMLQNMGPQVRQMLQSPEFRRMMTDPEQLRSMMAMQRAMGMGPGAGASAFPAPGNTDDTSDNQNTPPSQGAQQQQTPFTPFAAFGNPGAGAGTQAGNPFAALFNPAAFGNTPGTTSSPATSVGQGTPAAAPSTQSGNASGDERSQQTQNPAQSQLPPFDLNNRPLIFNNPEEIQQFLRVMRPNDAAGAGGDSNTSGTTENASGNNPPSGFNPNDPFGGLPPWAFAQMAASGWPYNQGGAQPPAPVDTRPPEERYADQLRQLNDMGFYEFERNVEALRRSGGSVQGAVEYLLTH